MGCNENSIYSAGFIIRPEIEPMKDFMPWRPQAGDLNIDSINVSVSFSACLNTIVCGRASNSSS